MRAGNAKLYVRVAPLIWEMDDQTNKGRCPNPVCPSSLGELIYLLRCTSVLGIPLTILTDLVTSLTPVLFLFFTLQLFKYWALSLKLVDCHYLFYFMPLFISNIHSKERPIDLIWCKDSSKITSVSRPGITKLFGNNGGKYWLFLVI